jgi:hypothetical protein
MRLPPLAPPPAPLPRARTQGGAHETVFFGYWSGSVPAVAELHFRSFLHHHPGARYELWLDVDDGSEIEAASLRWLETHPRIAVRRFSLNALIEKHVSRGPVGAYDRFGALRRLGRAVHGRLARLRPGTHRGAWNPLLPGPSYRHSSRLFAGFTADKAYRAHLARVLIPFEHYTAGSLYAGLDTCFLSDLRALCGESAWTWRWEQRRFAQPALLYLPGAAASATLAAQGRALGSFLPWVLFTDAACEALGIQVHPARLFAPRWDPSSLLYGDSRRFFGPRDQQGLDLYALALERHLAVHWDEHWDTEPAPTSIYAGLLKAACARPDEPRRPAARPHADAPAAGRASMKTAP